MELKRTIHLQYSPQGHPFNRTSMELKPFFAFFAEKCTFFAAFNRTSMELKQICGARRGRAFSTFNRTSMELKPFSSFQ